jgi:8-oxo-dGTP pyrophosphatase MutT (NUDIX family)
MFDNRRRRATANTSGSMSDTSPVSVLATVEPPAAEAAPAGQIAALCWRLHKGRPQILLVTSRDTGRWVLPKGWPINGLTPEAAAAREAWEEAGAEGKISPAALGSYGYDKVLPDLKTLPCQVTVFPMRIQTMKATFPERKERRRKWFSADRAAHMVAEADLRALLLRVSEAPTLLSPAPGAKRRKSGT